MGYVLQRESTSTTIHEIDGIIAPKFLHQNCRITGRDRIFSIYTDGRYRPLIRLFEDGLRKRSLTIRQACEIRRATRLRSDQQ